MIKEIIGELRNIDENTWGLYSFRRDPLHKKINHKDKIEMICKACDCGKKEALKLKDKYGSMSCREYAEKLGLEIFQEEERNADEYILFARFNAPNKVTIGINNVMKAEKLVEEENLNLLIDEVKIEDVLIAHEMFHFIEGENKDIYSSSKKITLWKLGPIKYESTLVALGEIAAMAFAKELLHLSYNPNLFDILLLYPHDVKRAKSLFDEVYDMKGADNNA